MRHPKRSPEIEEKEILFQPVKAERSQRRKSAFAIKPTHTGHQIEWGAIGVATFTVFVWSVIVGFAFGLLALICSFTIMHLIDDPVMISLLTFFGFMVGFLPLVKGTDHLITNIRHDHQSHCLIFATIVFLLNALVLVLLHDSETGLLEWLSLFLTYPVVLITFHLSSKKYERKPVR